MWPFDSAKVTMVSPEDALPGRTQRMSVAERHTVLGAPLRGPFAAPLEKIVLGMGCFWGAEKTFWKLPGVFTTAVGYAGGFTPNPTYREVCTGKTGHAEVVLVVYDPRKIATADILRSFWEAHDPTQGMRQGNDVGTQYRSAIYWTTDAQREQAFATRELYAAALKQAGFGEITTEMKPVRDPFDDFFFYAEDYHQQYLDKNPDGYCGLGGTGVTCPVWVGKSR